MRILLDDLVRIGRFAPVATWQRFGYWCGALLIASGTFHVAVYLVDGGAWEGPLSWRKPIVFGLSFGITVLTMTWIVGLLRPRAWSGWLSIGTLGLASTGEVVLISMQTWRGVASHFNEDTPFDGLVFSVMGMLVSIIGLITVAVAVWSCRRFDAAASLKVALRLGLLLMLVSQAVGVQMIVENGNTLGDSGALKMPHALTLHVVQVLPALALLLLAAPIDERRRVQTVLLGAVGYAAVIGSAMLHTYAGRGPFDFTPLSATLAAVGLTLLAASAVVTLRGLSRRSTPVGV